MKHILLRRWLFGILIIPLDSGSGWNAEKFSKIPAHTFQFSRAGLHLEIHASAMPLFYTLPTRRKILGFTLAGEFLSLPQFARVQDQGEKGADDYALRIGFIVPGDKQLTGLKRLIAAEWVKNLYAKIPEGLGLDRVQFFNITQNPRQLQQNRVHPLSDLLHEEFFALVEKPGPFRYDYTLAKPLDAVALWISSDGDDSKSNFDVLLSKLDLQTEP